MVKKLLAAVNKIALQSVETYYKHLSHFHQNNFSLQTIQSISTLNLL